MSHLIIVDMHTLAKKGTSVWIKI